MKFEKFKNEEVWFSDISKTNKPKKSCNTKKFLHQFFVIFSIFLAMFLSICLIHLLNTFTYEKVIERLNVEAKYDKSDLSSLLPYVELELNDKNFKLEHRLIPTRYAKHLNSNSLDWLLKSDILNEECFFTYAWQIFWASLESLTQNIVFNSENKQTLQLNQHEEYEFQVKQMSTNVSDIQCLEVNIKNSLDRSRTTGETEVCFDLGNNSWFGGHESYYQPYWPINSQSFGYVAYVTGFADDWGALLDRYWVGSNGVAIFVEEKIPLFVNHQDPNKICMKSSSSTPPYKYTSVYDGDIFEYKICSGSNIKDVHMFMIENFLGKPTDSPDLLMMQKPIFTTWSYFFRHINQTVVLNYAKEISSYNFSVSQIEIDDLWENKYGDLDFDKTKFPDPKQMVSQMHSMNQRVTLWIHPFCNLDSVNFVPGVENNYWVKDSNGVHPGFTSWWNGQNAVILDTTNPNSCNYFTNKLNSLKEKYKIDSFKFDAGETHWIPENFKLFNNQSKPDGYSQNYVALAANQNGFVEVRTGYRTQKAGIFYRILDRATDWTIHNGLKSVITATFHFGLLGYSFVLPDIICGNGDPDKSNKELFIRWSQLNAFMPAMQFGIVPWFFDEETVIAVKKYVDLRETVIFLSIYDLGLDGQPIIRPIWWSEPDNLQIFNITDQFLVGDRILVAPVLDPGITQRNVYFPGYTTWYDPEEKCSYNGSTTYYNVKASLDRILYFYSEEFSLKLNIKNTNTPCN